MLYFWRNFLSGLRLSEEDFDHFFIFKPEVFYCQPRLHFPGASIMKKRYTLLITYLIVFLSLLFVSCTSQESKTNPAKTEPTQTNPAQTYPIQTDQTTTDPVTIDPTTTGKLNQSQFVPLINSSASTADTQSTPGPNSIAPGQDLPPEKWQEWPVIPVISDHALDIYRAGIAQGNDPRHFSKVGDCQNIPQYFLGMFDTPGTFRLGEKYDYLQETIDYFSGSWGRKSEAVRTGFNVASVLTPLFADLENCQREETPLVCEIRNWNPSIALISMETWTAERPAQVFENYLRQIVEYAISKNVLPIVATKADNLEGDHAINQIIAKVAADYDIPLWNFWAATQPLTDQGLMEDRFHLTNGPNYFDSTESMDLGWPVRNLTGLLMIDTVWKAVK
jgi:hypothetical protein